MVDIDDDSLPGRIWETVAGVVGGMLAAVMGWFDQLLVFADGLLQSGGLSAVGGAVWAQTPTLFTMLSVAQTQFRGVLASIMPIVAWQALTVGVGVLFLLKLGDRFTDDLWARVRR